MPKIAALFLNSPYLTKFENHLTLIHQTNHSAIQNKIMRQEKIEMRI